MRRVFVSYNSIDRPRTVDVVRDLEAAGYEAWFDQDLTGGQEWWDVILEQIRTCDALVVAVTENSLDSAARRAEWQYAVELGKAIVPLQLEDTSIDLAPSSLQHRQWVDYRSADKQAAFSLVKAVNSAASPALPDPLPVPPALPLTYVAELRQQLDSAAPLTLQQQLTIVFQLRERLHDGGDARTIEQLLRRFKARDDLLAAVAPDVDQLLVETHARTDAGGPPLPLPPPPPGTGGEQLRGGGGAGSVGNGGGTGGGGGGGGSTPSPWLRPPRSYILAGVGAAAILAAVVIGVVALGGDDDGETASTTVAESSATSRPDVTATSVEPSSAVTTSSVGSSPTTAPPATAALCDPSAGERCIVIDATSRDGDALHDRMDGARF